MIPYFVRIQQWISEKLSNPFTLEKPNVVHSKCQSHCGEIKCETVIESYLFPVLFKNVLIGQFLGASLPLGQYVPLGHLFPVTPSVGLASFAPDVQ